MDIRNVRGWGSEIRPRSVDPAPPPRLRGSMFESGVLAIIPILIVAGLAFVGHVFDE